MSLFTLAACGGGGGGGSSAPAVAVTPPSSAAPTSTTVSSTGSITTGSVAGTTITGSGAGTTTSGTGTTTVPGAGTTTTTGSGTGTTAGGGTQTGTTTGGGTGETAVPKSVVAVAPVVTVQPQSVAVTSGQPASFNVTATSDSTLSYQWSRSGTPINGATTSTYAVTTTQLADSSARFTVTVSNAGGSTVSAAAILTVNAPPVTTQSVSAQRPFSDQSPWNSRPTRYTLGTFVVPKSDYYPNVAEGQFSTGAFSAATTDAPMSVRGTDDSNGIYIADAEVWTDHVTIPHWPANVVPASGSDGHADIVDVAANKIHSFYQLRNVGGVWRAQQYTWTALDGSGFGTPGEYFQGSRAAGVVTMAGLIRTAEIADGLPSYRHALAMSMTFNALAANPAYTFPATAADINAASLNSGQIPEGALMMLPASFDLSVIKDPKLLKIARTLQTFGAYVVDANYGTPYLIYVELGSGFNLMPNGWDNEIASELDQIRAAMRQVVSTSEWVDANGVVFTPDRKLNLLSMRGSWYVLQGAAPGVFDTWQQAVVFPDNGIFTKQLNGGGRSMPSSNWGNPVAGQTYKYTVKASGGAGVQLDLVDGNQQVKGSTGMLTDGQSVVVTWPAGVAAAWLTTISGPSGGGKAAATLVAQ